MFYMKSFTHFLILHVARPLTGGVLPENHLGQAYIFFSAFASGRPGELFIQKKLLAACVCR